MNWRDHIYSNPDILGGKPVVKGTRISAELILEYLIDGGSVADILDGYPSLTEEDVRAAVAFSYDILVKEAASARREAA